MDISNLIDLFQTNFSRTNNNHKSNETIIFGGGGSGSGGPINEKSNILLYDFSSTQAVFYNNNNHNSNENLTETSIGKEKNVIIDWKEICIVGLLCALIVITVIGNTLIILAVITTRRLRTVTNCFVMSLAVADWLVGIFVMPPAIALRLMGSWQLGKILCDIWISLDVLLCTASILSLCAISIDRYLAVTQPLNYSRRRRSKRLALLMILIVWILALLITCPPMLGWYEQGRQDLVECRYNQNQGYVVFSAMGSFFIPMSVMIYVYVKISCVVASRHDEMAEIEIHKHVKSTKYHDHDSSGHHEHHHEHQHNSEHHQDQNTPRKTCDISMIPSLNSISNKPDHITIDDDSGGGGKHKNGQYELVNVSRTPSVKSHNKTATTTTTKNYVAATGSNSSSDYCVLKNMRVHQKSLSNRISLLKRESKTTQTLSIVVGGFIACWLPFFIYYLITPFLPHENVSPIITSLLTWLGWINSAINPFIYAFYSVDFRTAFWRLTFRKFFKTNVRPPFTSNTVSIKR